MRNLLVLLTALVFATSAFAAQFEYSLKQYPKGDVNCHEAAAELGTLVATASGANVTRSLCTAVTSLGYDITVYYTADEPLQRVSTSASSFAIDRYGTYETEEACLANLDIEKEHFVASVGLDAAIAYCFYDDINRTTPWVVRIDGFGVSDVGHYMTGANVFGSPIGYSRERYLDEIGDALFDQGVDIRGITINGTFINSRLTVNYYAVEPISVLVSEYTKVFSEEHCSEQLEKLNLLLFSIGKPPVIMFCSDLKMGGQIELQTIYLNEKSVNDFLTIESFDGMDECMAGKAGLIDLYRNTVGRDVLDGFCTYADRTYKVRMFE